MNILNVLHDIQNEFKILNWPSMPRPKGDRAGVMSKKRPLREKLAIVEEWEKSGGSKYVVAKKYGLQSSQITRWARNKATLVERASAHPNNLTLHVGRCVTNPDAEEKLLAIYRHRRENDLPMTANILIEQVLTIDPNFHHGAKKALTSWVYGFIERNKLAVSRSKRNSVTEVATRRASAKPRKSTTSTTAARPKAPIAGDDGKDGQTSKQAKGDVIKGNQTEENSLLQPPTDTAEDLSAAACRHVRLFKDALGSEYYYAALDLLSDPAVARTFMVMGDDDRLGWLQWKLTKAASS
ncbi:hypothetical protein DYB28_012339 [Aphanomyces astaci]|uniref:HTH psq-type domain-containing protein n=2 Tax=Aphanomyces astaci TaxID=112090 RepID=A0A397ABH0_APHAT|nr:hypothetical protein DYB25_012413 [Aphanomyces astaci]RHY11926.1 hypothetical protein DYB36_005204 [Aphanomyces astaci]RLO13269.1 hypothetical protein DYB28_012339 [Aphanomyces astaci]